MDLRRRSALPTCWRLLAGLAIVVSTAGSAAGTASTADPRRAADPSGVPRVMSLGGAWKVLPARLRPAAMYDPTLDDQSWDEITVPGNWYAEGYDFSGPVWYRKRFSVTSGLTDRMATLVFEGVDYAADVWLNGQYLGFHEGYFAPFVFDVTSVLRTAGENVLAVRVDSPLERPGPSWSLHKRLIKGIFAHHDARPGGAWSARGQEQNTGGIWAPVYIEVSDLIRFSAFELRAQPGRVPRDPDPNATLMVAIGLHARVSEPTPVEIELRVEPEDFLADHRPFPPTSIPYVLRPGVQELSAGINCPGARLWWTWDRGEARRYRVTATIWQGRRMLAQRSDVAGFRAIAWQADQGLLRLNGERLFLRGTNYIGTQWLGEMRAERYGEDLALMQRAHVNAVRVHAHVAAKSFYEEADRRGMLIWQDFPLQWGYEESPELHRAVMDQAAEMVRHLFNHPSIMIWSGHNEPPWDADWMQYKYADYDPLQNEILDRDLAEALRRADPTRPVHPISSTAEHPWLGWYSGTWTDYRSAASLPLVTEFGAQALPDLTTLRTFIPAQVLWPESEQDWEPWAFHNFQRKETFEIAGVKAGDNVRQLIANTQQYQSDLIQLAAESYRRQRFAPVGSIFQFMFVECWPAISWAVVDHVRRPKPGYYALQTAYQPVLPSIEWTRRSWPQGETSEIVLWVVNDLRESFPNAHLRYAILAGDRVVASEEMSIAVAGDSVARIGAVPNLPRQPGAYELVVRLEMEGFDGPATNRMAFQILGPTEGTKASSSKPANAGAGSAGVSSSSPGADGSQADAAGTASAGGVG